ncbi:MULTISPECIES: hypothetical protein [Mesorhizobium]|uniref:hypothetical protein n=1 Tax=Mesorhizobium TaxID=68287 RepID=UPI0004CF873B|nr:MULTISPECIES: hypothetical protein [Mesorhizobium]WJI38565.1 hypothetical protein NL534_33215 [Mesorhizobium opportunistum]
MPGLLAVENLIAGFPSVIERGVERPIAIAEFVLEAKAGQPLYPTAKACVGYALVGERLAHRRGLIRSDRRGLEYQKRADLPLLPLVFDPREAKRIDTASLPARIR